MHKRIDPIHHNVSSNPPMEKTLYETTILNFRRLLKEYGLAAGILAAINGYLGDRGLSFT